MHINFTIAAMTARCLLSCPSAGQPIIFVDRIGIIPVPVDLVARNIWDSAQRSAVTKRIKRRCSDKCTCGTKIIMTAQAEGLQGGRGRGDYIGHQAHHRHPANARCRSCGWTGRDRLHTVPSWDRMGRQYGVIDCRYWRRNPPGSPRSAVVLTSRRGGSHCTP